MMWTGRVRHGGRSEITLRASLVKASAQVVAPVAPLLSTKARMVTASAIAREDQNRPTSIVAQHSKRNFVLMMCTVAAKGSRHSHRERSAMIPSAAFTMNVRTKVTVAVPAGMAILAEIVSLLPEHLAISTIAITAPCLEVFLAHDQIATATVATLVGMTVLTGRGPRIMAIPPVKVVHS